MTVTNIKQIILDQEFEVGEIFRNEKIIERELQKYDLQKYLKHPNILAILGVRRSGKSLLSLLLFKDKEYCYLNFDDERLINLETENLNKILQAFYELKDENVEYIILDEIQNVKGWELFVNRLRRTKKVIITGSNSRLLSGELSSHLTGRYISYDVFPFSFREFIKLKGFKLEPDFSTMKIAQIRNLLVEYIENGGFPEVHKFGQRILDRIYKDIIMKDIFLRYNILYKDKFRGLAKYLLSNFACDITFTKLANIFSITDIHTVIDYVSYLEQSYLIFLLNKFSYKFKEQKRAPKKVYSIDTGLMRKVAFQQSANTGRLYENIVALELMRRKSFTNSFNVYYWKNGKDKEIDFVLESNSKVIQLIQVCYDIKNPGTWKREIGSLVQASKLLKCKNLLVITGEHENEEEVVCSGIKRKITFIPLWRWLVTGY
ncbi:ATP-binding protein [bacterium]|nr:ATP-binding protein [bacterium]